MSGKADKTCNTIICWLGSAILHASIGVVALVASYRPLVSEEPPLMKTEMLMLEPPAPPAPEPPAPEPPAPEPPAPEPPAPEPPAPEPPAPKPVPPPPKPEPPKPVPVPKPEPPKPVPVPKPEPPKPPVPKPEPPKPVAKPKPPPPRRLSIAERLAQAKTVRAPQHRRSRPSRPVKRYQTTSRADLRRRWENAGRVSSQASSQSSSREGLRSRYSIRQRVEMESSNYGDAAVKPAYYEAWDTLRIPNKQAQPVVVELDVTSSGRVLNAWISGRSDDEQMNRSVEELIRRVRQFAPFSQHGIKAHSLHIVVTLTIN